MNCNYDNVIIGSGIAGLTVFYYLAELTKTRNLLITNNINSQTSAKFPLGPRFLHYNKDTEILLRRLGFDTKTREIFIGYKIENDIRNFPTDDFKKLYSQKARGTSKVEESFLTGSKSCFTAFNVSQVALAKSLLNQCLKIAETSEKNNIIIEEIKSIDYKKITTNKRVVYSDNIISTIPLNVLVNLISNSSITFKITSTPEKVDFFLIYEKGKEFFDYIYSVSDTWYRKTYVPEMDTWVYETKDAENLIREKGNLVLDRVTLKSQIVNSLRLKELGNIKLVGRYAQMNHSIKTEDVIKWAYNYTRKFKKDA